MNRSVPRLGTVLGDFFVIGKDRFVTLPPVSHATHMRPTLTSSPIRPTVAAWTVFATAAKERADAVFVIPDPSWTSGQSARIAEVAIKNRLPAIGTTRGFAEAGLLMSYGTNFAELWRRSATYVDKILKGAKPGDLPIEHPTKFDLAINLKTAKALGLTIPPSLLGRADQVIE